MNDSYKVNFNSTISNLRFGTAAKYGGETVHDDVFFIRNLVLFISCTKNVWICLQWVKYMNKSTREMIECQE